MAETLVEKKTCETCGADVRAGSVFCYNCGGAVSIDSPEAGKNDKKAIARETLLSEDSPNNDLKTTRLDSEVVGNVVLKPIDKQSDDEIAEKPIEKPGLPLEKPDLQKPIDKPIEKPNLQEEAKLKSAANMRRKAKTFQRKSVEIVWEEPESAPNKWFPIFAVLLILVVVGIFYLAIYLK